MLTIERLMLSERAPAYFDERTRVLVHSSLRHVVHVAVMHEDVPRHWIVMTSEVAGDLSTTVFEADEQGAMRDTRPVVVSERSFAAVAAYLEENQPALIEVIEGRRSA